MTLRKNARVLLSVAALLLFPGWSAFAWEADVHFGLTKWLALQAGFSREQAEWVASGDQGVDESWFTSPVTVTSISACIPDYTDPVGSILIHNNHFASKADTPNLPVNRAVKAGEIWQDGRQRPPPTVDGSEASFLALGRFLHAFQDTWSHQGVPDIPLHCKERWAFGHPLTRGGWNCHNADLTYIWQAGDVPQMALATYQILAGALAKAPLVEWKDLDPLVREFAGGVSKEAKDAWFQKYKFFTDPTDRDFLRGISLPDCDPNKLCDPNAWMIMFGQNRDIIRQDWNEIVIKTMVYPNVPQPVTRLFGEFFGRLTRQEDLSELIDFESVQQEYADALHVEGTCPKLYDSVTQFMTGGPFLAGKGAHQPKNLCDAVARKSAQSQRTSLTCEEAVRAARDGIEAALPRGPGLGVMQELVAPAPPYVYSVVPGPDRDAYSALGRFVHLSNDVLWLTARTTVSGPKITRILWAPNE
jgi:hypothetical protein